MAILDFSGVGTRARVTIYPPAVESLFLAGGDVWDWMERVGRHNVMEAIWEAPKRTGHLASMHNLALTPSKQYGVRYSVGNYADYAPYVAGGTTGPIQAGFWDDGKHAYLGPMAPWLGWNTLYAFQVRGQEANDWLSRARDLTLARYVL
jgi:hypothetical protein